MYRIHTSSLRIFKGDRALWKPFLLNLKKLSEPFIWTTAQLSTIELFPCMQ